MAPVWQAEEPIECSYLPCNIWLKALHIAFMVTWIAGLFYLPRLFIYHSDATDDLSRSRFTVMERRPFIIMSIGAVLTALFGFAVTSNRQLLRSLSRDPCRKLLAIVSATISAVVASHPDIDAGQVHAALLHTRGA